MESSKSQWSLWRVEESRESSRVAGHRPKTPTMAEALHRIAYDATIEDVVDVAFRFANAMHVFQTQLRTNVMIAGGIAGLALASTIVYQNGISVSPVMSGMVAGAMFAVFFGLIYKNLLIKEMRKQQRKIFAEQFGGNPTSPCD